MSQTYGIKVDDIFETMPSRFRPEAAKGIEASYGYRITGRGNWKLTVRNE